MLIYVLKLECEKYYVGRTKKTITERFKEHMSGYGSIFTKTYKPIRVIEYFESHDNYDEDKHTLKMMEKYGIDQVRGGSFVSEVLSNEEKNLIKKMINNASNWSKDEEKQLRKLFVDENKNILTISKIHKRMPLIILSRLQKMHLLQTPVKDPHKEIIVEPIMDVIKKPLSMLKV